MAAIPEEQRASAAFLATLAGAPPHETHISAVFVGWDTAWKMKKAVHLPYLDFSTLAARRHFLGRELALNRRTAPGIYRDVVAIRRAADGALGFSADGEIVEWVLRMAAVPAGDFFDRLATRGALTPTLARALADTVAEFHNALAPVAGWDSPGAFARLIAENETAARAAGLPPADIADWAAAATRALDAGRAILAARAGAGLVRRAHGDLHLGNVCLWHGRPTLFDALEFDETLATIDLGYDIAFLLMDLDQRVSREAANGVFNRYVGRRADVGLVTVLGLFLSLRALVRAHVEAARGGAAAGLSYLAAARRYLTPPGAGFVLAIGGLPGSGKSTLARALAPRLGPAPGALVLRSDDIRKRLHGVAPETRLPASAYDQAAHAAVQRALLAALGEAAAHHVVILDASFLDPAFRDAAAAAAARLGVPFVGIWLEAPHDILAARIAARRDDSSDATLAVLARMIATTPTPPPLAPGWHSLDVSDGESAAAAIRARLPPAALSVT
ncbi:MAG: AAA family ATPase [Acidibrevibacterium sp.]|uniref:bifunctional aminoglycoside phosphotransferase/ATP-binding protein n=1 Tax=Acidibrevibacterium sp. TaxID=2606776 RepID=UPI003CFD65A0